MLPSVTIQETRLFGVPIARVFVPETEALKRQFLPEMLRRYEARSYDKPGLWETDRIHTSFEAQKADQVINVLPAAYERLVRRFVTAERVNVQIWHSVYWTGEEYQERHHHIPAHLSFIHFLAFDRAEHKPPVFYDPARMIKAYCRHDAVPREFWSEGESIDVYEGDALVFPSYVDHRVPPGRYGKPRVTVSMNVTVLG
jgi:hypothetical protein